jgi:23S rRNA (pseudouridine1915-N3)-methyltransferase
MPIRIISVGKKHDALFSDAIEYYSKRLQPPFTVDWVLLPHSPKEGAQARRDESTSILARLSSDDYVILLDERGTAYESPAFSRLLQDTMATRGKITIIIGGAYGVDDALRSRADTMISLSAMVFPHQLTRLILAEQLYRANQIAKGSPYHHI